MISAIGRAKMTSQIAALARNCMASIRACSASRATPTGLHPPISTGCTDASALS